MVSLCQQGPIKFHENILMLVPIFKIPLRSNHILVCGESPSIYDSQLEIPSELEVYPSMYPRLYFLCFLGIHPKSSDIFSVKSKEKKKKKMKLNFISQTVI